MKKILSLILALTLMASLAIPVFAAGYDDTSGTDPGIYLEDPVSDPGEVQPVEDIIPAEDVIQPAEDAIASDDELPLVSSFSDVPRTHGFYSAIMDCAAKGITSGYSDGTFRPTNPVTRAQFCVMLSRAFYPNEVKKYDTDAYKAVWFGPNTKALSMAGVLKNTSFQYGFGDASIMDQTISRYDMAQLMTNIMTAKGFTATNAQKTEAQAKIADYKSIPSKYQDAVKNVFALGIITGYDKLGTFKGDNIMNRGQGCVVIYRMMQYTPATSKPSTGDTTYDDGKTDTKPGTTTTPTTKPSTGSSSDNSNTTTGATLSNGKAITESNVQALLNELRAKYPHGTLYATVGTKIYTNIYRPVSGASYGTQCGGWAALASDYIFGKTASVRTHKNFSQVRIGDVFYSKEHKMVITGTAKCVFCGSTGYTVCQSGTSYEVHWNEQDAVICLNCDLPWGTNDTIITRYPTDSTVPYLQISKATGSSGSNANNSGNTGSSSTTPSTGRTCDLCGNSSTNWFWSSDRSKHICNSCYATPSGKAFIA